MTDMNLTAGDVVIEDIFITTEESGTVDLINFVMQFEIYISVESNSMTMNVHVADSAGLITAIPILGQEKVTVRFTTPNIDESFFRTFIVHTISNRSLNRDREQRYTLECISEEAYINETVRLTNKFSGATDVLAETIFDSIASPRITFADGKQSSESILSVLDSPFSTNNFEFTCNYWSPFKALNFLASRSLGNTCKKTNVMFFESKSTFNLTPLEHLVKTQKDRKSIYDEYTTVESQEAPIYRDVRDKTYKYQTKYLNSKYHTIKSMDYPFFKSLVKNNNNGFHATSVFSYDFTTKRFLNMKYDNRPESSAIAEQDKRYLRESFSDFTPIGSYNTIADNTRADPLANRTFTPMSTSPYGSSYSRGVEQVRNQLVRNFAMSELNNQAIEITVPGKADVDVGLLARLIFPRTEDKTNQPKIDEIEDPFVSGLYMITAVKHIIRPQNHTMTLRLVRDSLGGL